MSRRYIFSLDKAQIERLEQWLEIQNAKQFILEKEKYVNPENLIMELMWKREMPLYGGIGFYFGDGAITTHVKVIYKITGAIIDLSKDDCDDFLYDYNEDFSIKYFMGKEVTEEDVLGVDR